MSTFKEISDSFQNLDSNSATLEFILKRIKSDNYRGEKSAQQNRYTIEQIKFILRKITEKNNEMPTPPGDSGKFPKGYQEYIDFSKQFSQYFNKDNSENTIKKNIFPDLNTMGFIETYKINGKKLTHVTDLGIDFLNSDIINSRLKYSKAIDKLFKNLLDNLIDILSNDYLDQNYVTLDEILLFVSAIGSEYKDYSISLNDAVSYIKEYRKMGIKRKSVIQKLNDSLKPINFNGNKTNKRDFHNWKNKYKQFCHMLNDSLLLEYNDKDEKVYLKNSIKKDGQTINLLDKKRSEKEKNKYFEFHKIKKEKNTGFELHHIIEFSEAETIEQLSFIDNWKNMLFIDGTDHNKITQSRKSYYYMDYDSKKVSLSTFDKNEINLTYDTQIYINKNNLKEIKNYNSEIINKMQ